MSRTSSVLLVARWSLGELLWSPRTLAMLVIAAAPVGIAFLYRVALALTGTRPESAFGTFSAVVAGAGFAFVAPMLALFYASGVVSDDVEAGTLRYFLTRPIPRGTFLAGKMLGTFSMAALLFLPAMVLSYCAFLAPAGWHEMGAHFPTLAVDLVAAVLGLSAYNGVFALLGTALRRPLLAGLFFIFGWQAVATFVPGSVHYLTVAHYLNSLVPQERLEGALSSLAASRSSALASVAALVVIAALTHALAIRSFGSKEL